MHNTSLTHFGSDGLIQLLVGNKVEVGGSLRNPGGEFMGSLWQCSRYEPGRAGPQAQHGSDVHAMHKGGTDTGSGGSPWRPSREKPVYVEEPACFQHQKSHVASRESTVAALGD